MRTNFIHIEINMHTYKTTLQYIAYAKHQMYFIQM